MAHVEEGQIAFIGNARSQRGRVDRQRVGEDAGRVPCLRPGLGEVEHDIERHSDAGVRCAGEAQSGGIEDQPGRQGIAIGQCCRDGCARGEIVGAEGDLAVMRLADREA